MHEGHRTPAVESAIGLEKPQDECGVFGIFAPQEPVATLTYAALQGLQGRGQSGAGIFVALEGFGMTGHKGLGLVDKALGDVLPKHRNDRFVLDEMGQMSMAIGHVRYSTSENEAAAQPFKGDETGIAVSHNGHIEGAIELATRVYGIGTDVCVSDSHAFTLMLDKCAAEKGIEPALAELLPQLNGAYCFTIIDGERLIGVRDPWGFHPLALGQLPDNKGYMLASESVVFGGVASGARHVRDIQRGEIIVIEKDPIDNTLSVRSSYINRTTESQTCAFEFIYTARPDGQIDGISVYRARKNMGRILAETCPAETADVVIAVPNSGRSAAAGFAEVSGKPVVEGLFTNPYAKRSFLQRGNDREATLRSKFQPNGEELAGRSIVLVDDSLIKGNTMKALIGLLREAGAAEIHVRLAAPQYRYPCYMGMDTGTTSELIARYMSEEAICAYIGADSIGFNTPENVQWAVDEAATTRPASIESAAGRLCTACATGKYPFLVPGAAFLGLPVVVSERAQVPVG